MSTSLGERIREQRRKKGLTLEQLAAASGSSKSYMWEIENKDVARPSAEKLQAIAQALNTTMDYLLAAEGVTEAGASDRAFFYKYREMPEKTKRKLQRILELLDDDEEEGKMIGTITYGLDAG